MSANVEGRGVSVSSPPAEGPYSESTVVTDTLNTCRMTQSMIDITAKQLFGLRQCQTSEDLIQKEICECEVSSFISLSQYVSCMECQPVRSHFRIFPLFSY